MKIINRYIACAAMVAMLFSSCTKDETNSPADDPSVQTVDLTFGALLNDLANRSAEVNKNHFAQVPDCSDGTPAVAVIGFSYGGADYEAETDILSDESGFFTDYSEDLKIPVPNNSSVEVTLTSFMVYDGDPDGDGELIWIAPIELIDGEFDGYVENALPFSFDVSDGTKPYIDVEVLCYDRRMANEYGYVFFDILPEVIYPLCLFVNYCDENGRHFVADYSVDLYFGTDDTGIQLYDYTEESAMATTGDYGQGDYYAEPLCLVVPGPPANLPSNQPYLYMVIYPQDWDGTGDVDNSPIGGITLSWDMVSGLLNDDGETNEYLHLLIGECDGALSGDGNGGGNGDDDLDDDGVTNDVDQCPNTPDGVAVNDVGCPDTDGDGIFDNEDDCPTDPTNTCNLPCANSGGDSDEDGICDDDENEGCISDPDTNCGETNGPVACDLTIPAPDSGCSEYFLEGLDGFIQITQPAGEFPDPYFIVPEGGGDDDRIGSVTIQLSDDLYPVVTVILNEGFSADDYIIEVKDESGSDVTCENGVSLPTPGGDEPDIFEEFSNLGNYDYSFFVRIQINACSAN